MIEKDILLHIFNSLFTAFIIAAVFAPIMINILYRANQTAAHKKAKLGGGIEEDNSLYLKIMNVSGKNGIPNMGGILVWLVVPLTMWITLDLGKNQAYNLIIFSFLIFGFWGFLDVLFTNLIKNNPDLKTFQEKFGVRLVRFFAAAVFSMVIIYLGWDKDIIDEVNLLLLTIPLSLPLVLILGIVGQFAVYSAEITDGLDGLMIGIFGISFTAFAALILFQGHYELLPVIGIMIGVILVDLYFNINPARFYNGGPGAMPLGFVAFFMALLTDNLIPYFLIFGITWLIMSSSMIQILSMRFFKKRVFKMAPIHHHFQVMGWSETKITMRFWLIDMVFAIIGIYIGIQLL